MVQFKTVESPVHWSYCSLTLGHKDMHLWPMHGTCPPEREKGLVYIGLFEDRGHQGPYSHISTNPFNILTCLHNQICPPPLHSPINTVAFHMQTQGCSRLTHQPSHKTQPRNKFWSSMNFKSLVQYAGLKIDYIMNAFSDTCLHNSFMDHWSSNKFLCKSVKINVSINELIDSCPTNPRVNLPPCLNPHW